jgi:deoxyribodipyrimidine photolyase-related protein
MSERALRLIFADQLSHSINTLKKLNKESDVVVFCEVMEEATYVPHHPKKIAFLFAAMRHFAQELQEKGVTVHYITLDDENNRGSFTSEVKRLYESLKPDRIIVTEPSEYRVLEMVKLWQHSFSIPVDILPDTRFLATHDEFSAWAYGKKQLRMEFFYRIMRQKYHILMDKTDKPEGGEWNYDKENRKPPERGMKAPARLSHKKSVILKNVLELVSTRFSHHFGSLEPFHYAVTRDQAVQELEHFITKLLPNFGDYQDAMVAGEPFLYHSLISSYLNAGLLLPLEICQKAEKAYKDGKAPLNAVEGFIRQILGWREYIRGIYWYHMPEYGTRNSLNSFNPLPDFYWTAKTNMFCMRESIEHTRDHAYSHHIQRLMITGNFALLTGLDVNQVQEWYLAVYSDAYEWVEMPNTLGMALFGDDCLVASKPYAASGKYINKMSNYCKKCFYDPNEMLGEKACPFNALYWNFMIKNEDKLRKSQRMPYVFSNWDKFTPEKKEAILNKANLTLKKIACDVPNQVLL